jgi:hypothetical protein
MKYVIELASSFIKIGSGILKEVVGGGGGAHIYTHTARCSHNIF